MTNFMVTEGARLRRMTRGKSSLQDRDIFFEQLKRMSDFGFGERTRPRMGKRGITFFLKSRWTGFSSMNIIMNIHFLRGRNHSCSGRNEENGRLCFR